MDRFIRLFSISLSLLFSLLSLLSPFLSLCRLGDVERARTIFEKLVTTYPKRVDLWSVYLDKEQQVGDQAMLRQLYERATSLNLSTKKMKFFFKRFLDFEREHGTADQQEHVRAKARAYVESKVAK